MKRILLYTVASYLLMNVLSAAQTGKTGLSFLKLGVDARALGMGESYTAITNTPAGTYYNPASISNSSHFQLLVMHKEWIQDMRTEFISATTSLNNFSFGLSINSTSIKNIELRTIPGPALGNFDAQDASIGLTSSYNINPELNLGITSKIIYEKIFVNEATGFAFDLGGIYRTPWNIDVGLSVNNFGTMDELQNEASKLPTSVRAGGMYQTQIINTDGTLTFVSDIVSYTGENKTHIHAGAEFAYMHTLAIRFGYQTGYEAKNIAAGIGFQYGMFHLDYAFVPFRYDFGATHTFSLGISFD